MPYCTSMGRSKPYSARSAACRAGSMPRSPAIVSIGSPGTRRIRKNATRVIPRKVGITKAARVTRKRSIAAALLEADPVEGVAAERRDLEALHLLAHGLQLHRVRDGEPGRLLLEHHL